MSSFGPLWQVAKELPLKTVEKDRLQKKVAIRSHGEILQFVLHMQYSIIAPFQSLLQLGVSRILHLQINLCKARISHNSPKMFFQNVTPPPMYSVLQPFISKIQRDTQKQKIVHRMKYRESSHIMVSPKILYPPICALCKELLYYSKEITARYTV